LVRKIKVVEVYSQEEEPEIETIDEDDTDDTDDDLIIEETNPPAELKNEVIIIKEEEEEPQPPPPKSKTKQVLDMPTTDKVVQQVQCLACGKSMSAKNLKYSHAKYCTERSQEPQPVEIPVPKIETKKTTAIRDRKSLTVKRTKIKQEEEEDIPETPSRQNETPEQFWNNTVKNMRERKLSQYKFLCSNAF
jgi:hypothetical protein